MDSHVLPDRLWAPMEPLVPPPPAQPKDGRPPVPARRCTEAIWFVMRTGCQWRALNATGICSSATAERRFREWKRAGVFERLRATSVDRTRTAGAVDWGFLAVDGCRVEAPLARTKRGAPRFGRGRQGSSGRRLPTATAPS